MSAHLDRLVLILSIGSAACGEKSAPAHSASVQSPGAQVVVLPGAAHLTPWDARDESIRAVRTFLRAADSSSGNP